MKWRISRLIRISINFHTQQLPVIKKSFCTMFYAVVILSPDILPHFISLWYSSTISFFATINLKTISTFSDSELLPTGQGRSTLATSLAENLFFHYSRIMIWSNKIFDDRTNWILSDRLHEIWIKILKCEISGFESRKCCGFRSALTCTKTQNWRNWWSM